MNNQERIQFVCFSNSPGNGWGTEVQIEGILGRLFAAHQGFLQAAADGGLSYEALGRLPERLLKRAKKLETAIEPEFLPAKFAEGINLRIEDGLLYGGKGQRALCLHVSVDTRVSIEWHRGREHVDVRIDFGSEGSRERARQIHLAATQLGVEKYRSVTVDGWYSTTYTAPPCKRRWRLFGRRSKYWWQQGV